MERVSELRDANSYTFFVYIRVSVCALIAADHEFFRGFISIFECPNIKSETFSFFIHFDHGDALQQSNELL